MVATNVESISGPWLEGFVLDRHVVSSVPTHYIGEHLQYDTKRTALGELLYQLKYRGGSADDIVDTAAAFALKQWPRGIDLVVAPPPSVGRQRQPAATIASGIAERLGVEWGVDVVTKPVATTQMKNSPTGNRAVILKEAIQPGSVTITSKSILIVDDLWETGSTLRRVAEVVKAMGASEVRALVMTRTK